MATFIVLLTELMGENSTHDILYIIANRRRQILASSVTIHAAAGQIRHSKPRIENYVEYVMPLYSIDDFHVRFRLSRASFDQLAAELFPHLETRCRKVQIGLEKQLLFFVKYVSSLHPLQDIADMFGVCESTVHVIIKGVSAKICEHLLPSVIKWPTSEQHIADIVEGFQQLKGFPAVLGAIDGSHIPIRTPKEYPENYINRKNFPSVILQAVCDSNLNFTDVYCGWPGSVHDARVLKRSPLYNEIEADPDKKFPGNTHMLGDSAYGLSCWLLVPFRDYVNLKEPQKRFNYVHSATRICIECAFGVLKGRFRRLKYIDMLDVRKNVNVILSCCVLHQLCLRNMEDIKEYLQEGLPLNEEINNFQDFMPKSHSAEIKRNQILEALSK